MKILVADDDFISRTVVVRLLEKIGYEVEIYEDGGQALRRMREEDAPQMAILDWMMPVLDGPDIIRALRQEKEVYPYLILLTNRTDTSDKVEGLESGADDYLVKPVNPGELQARVHVGIRFLELQKRLEEKSRALIRLEQEQKSASLAKMAGGVAHHMNNKLQAVIGYLDLIQMEFMDQNLLGPEELDMLKCTRDAALEASDIGKKMLSYLSQNQGKQERLDVKGLLQGVLLDLTREFPVLKNARIEAPEAPLAVLGNSEELHEVFYQILRNAMEAAPETAPALRLEGRDGLCCMDQNLSIPNIFTPVQDPDEKPCVNITVQDQGVGIPKHQIGQIFDPFFSTKFTGRGLGLPVVTGIIKKLGGGVRISCPFSGGTRAEICLPLLKAEA